MRSKPPQADLERLIRENPTLDASLRRHWLRVLPHLKPADQERLRRILQGESAQLDAGAAGSPSPS